MEFNQNNLAGFLEGLKRPLLAKTIFQYVYEDMYPLFKQGAAKKAGHSYIVNGNRFAELNLCGFYPMKFFMGELLWCLMFKAPTQRHYMKLNVQYK